MAGDSWGERYESFCNTIKNCKRNKELAIKIMATVDEKSTYACRVGLADRRSFDISGDFLRSAAEAIIWLQCHDLRELFLPAVQAPVDQQSPELKESDRFLMRSLIHELKQSGRLKPCPRCGSTDCCR